MTLQRIFQLTVVLLVGSALVAAGTLVVLTGLLHRVAVDLQTSTEGIRAAEELEAGVLLHNRASMRHLATGEPQMAAEAERALRAIRAELADIGGVTQTPAEAELIEVARERVEAYLEVRSELQQRGAGLLETYRGKGPHLEAAVESLEALSELNIDQARAARARAQRWDLIAKALGTATGVALALGAIAALVLLQRQAVRPVGRISEALRQYAQGDRTARAPEVGATELASVAREFNRMADALARQREEQLAFIGGVAHDLRNPLMPLKLAVLAAGREDPTGDRVRRVLPVVARQAERLERMITDLLEVARIEAGHLELRPEVRDAREIVREVQELNESAEDHELVASLPADPVPLRCDPARIEQVLNNLISNAMKYSPRGTRVEVDLTRRGDQVVFSVRDQGQGIAPEEQERIFEPFRRGGRHAASADVPGVGLGLAVVRRIVLAHDGRVELVSAPGAGTTFRVFLPGIPEQAAAPAVLSR